MTAKLIGALIVLIGCGGCGFMIALSYKRETFALKQLLSAIDFMQCELRYKMTPLPALCRLTAGTVSGQIKYFFETLGEELEQQISPNVKTCVDAALSKCKMMPQLTQEILSEAGNTLGMFDLAGQLQSLDAFKEITENKLKIHTENQEVRIRSYQTLGLCAGAAIAILFI